MLEVGAAFGYGGYFRGGEDFLAGEFLEFGDGLFEVEAGFVAGACHS